MERLHRLQQDRIERKLCFISAATIVDRDGEIVDEEMHEDLKTITKKHTEEIEESNPENSFKRLFWNNKRRVHLRTLNPCDGTLCS